MNSPRVSLGIDSLLALTTAIAAFANVVGEVMHDNKVNYQDLPSLGGAIGAISDLTEVDFDAVVPEANDLNGEEQEQLAEHFRVQFKLENAEREESLEKGFDYLLQGIEAFKLLKKLSDKIQK